MSEHNLIKDNILEYLHQHEQKQLLRFITCGSVDDGKSTLIGRLLYETKGIFADQLAALKSETKYKRTDDDIDFSLLIDGLQAEREQGITIDVAYRYFSTDKRKFIISDTPGHEQYTRNMATGASNADLAVILIDGRNGVLTQTKRHTFIVTLLGIKSIIVAINKMDLINYDEKVFNKIKDDYTGLIEEIGRLSRPYAAERSDISLSFIPISALKGDNVVKKSEKMPWYKGSPLLECLNTVEVGSLEDNIEQALPFRFPVQYVNRPNSNFRGYCGTIASGTIKEGDEITVLPSRTKTKVKSIIPPTYEECECESRNTSSLTQNSSTYTHTCTVIEAFAPMSVTLTTEDEVDITRGDMIVKTDNFPDTSDCFDAYVVWMNEEPLKPNRIYDIKRASTLLTGYIDKIYYKINVNTLEKISASSFELNEIGLCRINLSSSIAYDSYNKNRQTGSFIIIDRITNNTVGAGMIQAKKESRHVIWHEHKVSIESRVKIKGHKPCLIWLTGLSGAGKSTIANGVEEVLNKMMIHTYLLDGDNIRHGLNNDLGFSPKDRKENIRRISEVAKLFVDAGLIAIASFISPFKEDRKFARSLLNEKEFIEVFINAPLNVCEKRDSKGFYKKARKGEIKEFTGISSPYESPDNPEIHIKTDQCTVDEAIEKIVKYLKNGKFI